MNSLSKRPSSPRSSFQVLRALLRVPSLRNQIMVMLLVGGLTGGCLLLGAAALIDLWIPLFSSPLGSFRIVFLGASALILACMGYGHWIERRWVEVTRVRIPTPKLPSGSKPIRIVHLSDLHCTDDDTLERRLPKIVNPLSPDLILFTGDYLASSKEKGMSTLKTLFSSLQSPFGLYAVLGNHEVWYTPHLDLFKETPVALLKNEIKRLSIRGAPLSLIGIEVEEEKRGMQLLQRLSPGTINVLLYHYPDLINQVSDKGIDLFLAGHTHGGQIALPFFGAIVTLSKGWKRYERGLYRVGEASLYVNRGLGSDGGVFPTIRFFSRPEIAVIDLFPAEEEAHAKRPLAGKDHAGYY